MKFTFCILANNDNVDIFMASFNSFFGAAIQNVDKEIKLITHLNVARFNVGSNQFGFNIAFDSATVSPDR